MTSKIEHVRTNFKNEKRAALGVLGEWDWSDGEVIRFTSDGLGFKCYGLPNGFGVGPPSISYVPGFSYGLGVGGVPRVVWRFDGETGAVSIVAVLESHELIDKGLQCSQFVANKNGMALIYESGLIFFDSGGKILWQKSGLGLDWHLYRVDDSRLVFTNLAGERRIYSLDQGLKS